MLKKLQENQKENDNDVDADVAQLERSNNKCYVSTFRYIYIYIYIYRCVLHSKWDELLIVPNFWLTLLYSPSFPP